MLYNVCVAKHFPSRINSVHLSIYNNESRSSQCCKHYPCQHFVPLILGQLILTTIVSHVAETFAKLQP